MVKIHYSMPQASSCESAPAMQQPVLPSKVAMPAMDSEEWLLKSPTTSCLVTSVQMSGSNRSLRLSILIRLQAHGTEQLSTSLGNIRATRWHDLTWSSPETQE